MGGCVGGWVGEWMCGWVAEWMCGWVGGWVAGGLPACAMMRCWRDGVVMRGSVVVIVCVKEKVEEENELSFCLRCARSGRH